MTPPCHGRIEGDEYIVFQKKGRPKGRPLQKPQTTETTDVVSGLSRTNLIVVAYRALRLVDVALPTVASQ
jgi:hypothetical protein